MAEQTPLKLRARDGEDMDVIAALLQDALVPLADITYQKSEKRFILVANRFNWPQGDPATPNPATPSPRPGDDDDAEDAPFEDATFEDDGEPQFERVNSGVCFDRVRHVRFKDLDPRAHDEIVNLLTIKTEPGAITLMFSGGGGIRLEVSDVICHLEDIGQTWPTRWRPQHDAEAATPDAQAASDSGGIP